MIELGKTYRDVITNFQGVATGHCEYLSGCHQTLLAPPVSDGAWRDPMWFDDQRLVCIGDEKISLDNSITPGFDKQAPKR